MYKQKGQKMNDNTIEEVLAKEEKIKALREKMENYDTIFSENDKASLSKQIDAIEKLYQRGERYNIFACREKFCQTRVCCYRE